MEKYLRILLPILIVSGGIVALWIIQSKPESKPAGSAISWHMSRAEVKTRVNTTLSEETDTSLRYVTPENTIEYLFHDGKLSAVTHRSNTYDSYEQCLAEYGTIQEFMVQKYGKPQEEKEDETSRQSIWEVPEAHTRTQLLITKTLPYRWVLKFAELKE
jgi:hypothetical protein